MQQNLLTHILEWMKCQPNSLKHIFTLKIVQIMPFCNLSYSRDELLDDFSIWLLSQATDEKKSYGATLALKAIIDFVIKTLNDDTNDYYQRIGAIERAIDRLLNSPDSEEEISSLKEYCENLLAFPNAVNQISDSWLQFCEKHFSLHASTPNFWQGALFLVRSK